MDFLILILPEIIAGLIVAVIAMASAVAFHILHQRRRIAQLRQVESECWDILRMQEDLRKFLKINMEGANGFGEALQSFKKQPTQENLAEVVKALEKNSAFLEEQLDAIKDKSVPVAERRERARDELSKLQSGLSD